MLGQTNIFSYLQQKPPVGSTLYFATGGKIKEAVVISHDASFAGHSYDNYFKVKTKNGETWSIVHYYTSSEDVKNFM